MYTGQGGKEDTDIGKLGREGRRGLTGEWGMGGIK